jgi:hypothetical protein
LRLLNRSALVGLGVRHGARSCLRIAVIPQRRPARRGDAGRLGFHPDVIEDVSDVGAAGDEGL